MKRISNSKLFVIVTALHNNISSSRTHVLIFISILFWKICSASPTQQDCLKSSNENNLPGTFPPPKCKIVENVKQSMLNPSPVPSYECIYKWENTLYLQREGDISIDCTADYPLDLEYDGVLPTTGLRIQYYKNILGEEEEQDEGLASDLTLLPMTYRIKIHLIARELKWSANYIIHEAGNVNNSMEISVFIGKNDLPIFLPMSGTNNPLKAYISGGALVIPCRVANINSTVKLYHDFVEVERDDSESITYDPRRGYYLKPTEEDDVNSGEYECSVKFQSMTDRIKAKAKQGLKGGQSDDDDEDDDDDEEAEKDDDNGDIELAKTEENLQNISGTIIFEKADNNTYNAYCQLPLDSVDLDTLAFTNILSKNPTFSRLERKCLGFEHACDERRKFGLWEVEDPKPMIESVFPSGIMKCFDKSQQEVMEYFTGSDDIFYTDWNNALAQDALIKVESSDSTYFAGSSYEFHCKYPQYIAAFPVWWAIKFQNGTVIEALKYNSKSTYVLSLEHKEIHCGFTLWNHTTWYKNFIPLEVKEPVALPVFLVNSKVIVFKEDAENQGLRCDVAPEPKATLEWYRDGEPVGDSIPTLPLEDSLILFFKNINATYEGNYTCVATANSGGGKLEAEFQIKLERNDTQEDDETGDKIITKEKSPEPDECKNSPSFSLFQIGSDNEISSLELVNPNEVLLLRLNENNCSLEAGVSGSESEKEQKLWIRVIGSGDNELSSFLDIGQPEDPTANNGDNDMGLGLGRMDGTVPLVVIPITENEEIEEQKEEVLSSAKSPTSEELLFSQLLLPILFGFASILLILIFSYLTYSYYVSPWKVGKITRVSSIRLSNDNKKQNGMI